MMGLHLSRCARTGIHSVVDRAFIQPATDANDHESQNAVLRMIVNSETCDRSVALPAKNIFQSNTKQTGNPEGTLQ